MRRWIRECFRLSQMSLVGLDIVVMAKNRMIELQDFDKVCHQLRNRWKDIIDKWKAP